MADRLTKIAIDAIVPADDNLRAKLTDIDDLATSIGFIGLLEPIRVTKNEDGATYKVIAGHRRLEALKQLGWTETAAIVQSGQITDEDRTAAMLIENMQRVDLSIDEQTEGVRRLITDYGMSQADVAMNLGVSKQWVQDRIAILNVPGSVIRPDSNGNSLSVKHLAMLGSLEDKRRERLLEGHPKPTAYAIEDASSKQLSAQRAEREFAKALKDGYLVCKAPQLKKLLAAEYTTLSGVDQLIKTVLGAATRISDGYGRPQSGEVVARLSQIYTWDTHKKDKRTIYVLKNSGGYQQWNEVKILTSQDTAVDPELAAKVDEIEERNEARREEWEAARMVAQIQFLKSAKPAELIEAVLVAQLQEHTTGWRSEHRIMEACQLLGLPFGADVATDPAHKEANFETIVSWATKNASNLARASAAFRLVRTHGDSEDFAIEYPAEPEYENWGEDDDDVE